MNDFIAVIAFIVGIVLGAVACVMLELMLSNMVMM